MALALAAARRRVGDAGDALGGRWAAYELVLRRLTADDRLCAALACRAFRDVLFALTAAEVKTRKPKDAPQPRFRTAPRALACSAGRLRWARGLGAAGPLWLQRWDASTCGAIARHGAVAALRWARASGCAWDTPAHPRICAAAAGGGRLEMLQWAHDNGCPKT